MQRLTPKSTLFPYTTLFRSKSASSTIEPPVQRRLREAIPAKPEPEKAPAKKTSAGPKPAPKKPAQPDRKSTRLNSSHVAISYAVFCLKKKNIPHVRHLITYS